MNVEYEGFLTNQMLLDAVIRNLEIIGEAARNLSDDVRMKYKEIPWRNMIGLRNILIHEYFGIDESIVWEVATRNLKEIKPGIIKAIQEEGDFT
ncbi:HepT-like ribonuclease domain-containing protein [Paenibacillus macerans]|uniref:HepT-like ribonuclease domain-containing protein n=1 Tax=Paenibacillus macerans TaxID=44252 RepID=UPI003D320252